MLRLILPDTRYLESYVAALREGFRIGVRALKTEEEIQAIEKDPFNHFEEYNIQGGYFTPEDGIQRPRVMCNTLWLVNEEDFIGAINLRYVLNDFLEKHAGHVGYGVRPSMMRQGYATKMLALGLEKLKQQGVMKVMLTADENNRGSWKAIEANGGVMTDTHDSVFNPGSVSRTYWIDLSKDVS